MNNEFNVGEVLRESFNFMIRKPVIVLPMLILFLFERILGLVLPSFIDIPDQIKSIEDIMPVLPSLLTYFIISFVLIYIVFYAIVDGMYPLMVKNIMGNKEIELNNTFSLVLKRAPTLIVASILVSLIVFAGIFLLIIPGVIFGIWYFYTFPFIMLENRGVLDGMRASKAFASDKKLKTFYLFMIWFFIIIFVGFIVDMVGFVFSSIPMAFSTIRIVSDSVLFAWISIIPAHIYLKTNENIPL